MIARRHHIYQRNRASTRSRTMLYGAIVIAAIPFLILLQSVWVSQNQSLFQSSILERQTRSIECDHCGGLGFIPDQQDPSKRHICPLCYGMGGHLIRKFDKKDKLCPLCGGMGRVLDEETGEAEWCPRCGGRGVIRERTETGKDDLF